MGKVEIHQSQYIRRGRNKQTNQQAKKHGYHSNGANHGRFGMVNSIKWFHLMSCNRTRDAQFQLLFAIWFKSTMFLGWLEFWSFFLLNPNAIILHVYLNRIDLSRHQGYGFMYMCLYADCAVQMAMPFKWIVQFHEDDDDNDNKHRQKR